MAVKTIFLKTVNGTGSPYYAPLTFQVPNDFESLISVEAIGSGWSRSQYSTKFNIAGAGGAYAKTTNITGLAGAQTLYYYISQLGFVNEPTWLSTTGVAPTVSTDGVLAVSGRDSSTNPNLVNTGGPAASCVGTTTYSGGDGLYGGGGAAGPNGAGANGGSGFGGGGGGANSGSAGQDGGQDPATYKPIGGSGGNNRLGQGGGLGAITATPVHPEYRTATSGTAGGGGGGGATIVQGTSAPVPGNGSQDDVWTQSSNGEKAGPGGGGGSHGDAENSPFNGGNGGGYGAGGGSGPTSNWQQHGINTQGIIVFTYNAIDPTITIVTQPQNTTAVAGDTVTFSVTATVDLPNYSLNYQWQKADATDPYTWSNIVGANGASYTTGIVQSGYGIADTNGDKYRCVIGVGGTEIISVTNEAILTVIKSDNFLMMF